MNRARFASLGLVVVLGAACSSGLVSEETGGNESALSFPGGNDDGFCASNPGPSCTHGTPVAAKRLVLTFDDGPGSQTLALSAFLKAQGIRATFFVNGQHLSAHPGVLAQMAADGHLIGNHTQDHPDLRGLSGSALVTELSATDTLIAPYVASGHFVFRAPYGYWSAADYTVLHASAMNKYVGPVKWDIGGTLSAAYAADWDCWQNQSGNGVMTSKQCGDRYMKEMTDVGRGIVLMHDADYGDLANHNQTVGMGNTVDMVKYMIPVLKAQGYTFARVDEVPDIAALFGAAPVDAGVADGGACAWNPTWAQTTYANEWWVEYAISGSVASAALDVASGQTVTLSKSYDKWVGAPAAMITSGTQVTVRATSTTGLAARTQPFAYLVTTSPATACTTPTDAGVKADAGTDAGVKADAGVKVDAGAVDAGATDAGSCSSALAPAWSQGSGANSWWVEYAITSKTTIASAYLEVASTGRTVPLTLQWGKWVGSSSASIATGTSVVVHAQDTLGNRAQTAAFAYLSLKTPTTKPCN